MDTPAELLRRLGLRTDWIYEAVVCTYLDGTPHAAPAGVRSGDGVTLCLDLYQTSRSLRAATAAGAFVVDFPRDAGVLYTVLHEPAALCFAPAGSVAAPCLTDACARLELLVEDLRPDGALTHVRGRVAAGHVEPGARLLNRAEGLLLESLILVTRADLHGRQPTLERLREHRRVIDKVAPGSAYSLAMARLLRDLETGS